MFVERDVKKCYKLMISVLLLVTLITLGTIYLYQIIDSQFTKMVLQNISYLASLVCVFVGIKISRKPLSEFGLFSHTLLKQLSIGLIGGLVLLLMLKRLSFWPPSFNAYLIISQLLVAFAEEMIFRGFLYTMIYEISKAKSKSIIISSLLFGIYHYPLGHNIVQVVSACIVGLIYSGLRSVYFRTDKEIGIIPLTMMHWINNIL